MVRLCTQDYKSQVSGLTCLCLCVSVLRAEVFVVVSSPQCLITGQMDGWMDVRSLYQQLLGS